jgi:hypothetical protein
MARFIDDKTGRFDGRAWIKQQTVSFSIRPAVFLAGGWADT